ELQRRVAQEAAERQECAKRAAYPGNGNQTASYTSNSLFQQAASGSNGSSKEQRHRQELQRGVALEAAERRLADARVRNAGTMEDWRRWRQEQNLTEAKQTPSTSAPAPSAAFSSAPPRNLPSAADSPQPDVQRELSTDDDEAEDLQRALAASMASSGPVSYAPSSPAQAAASLRPPFAAAANLRPPFASAAAAAGADTDQQDPELYELRLQESFAEEELELQVALAASLEAEREALQKEAEHTSCSAAAAAAVDEPQEALIVDVSWLARLEESRLREEKGRQEQEALEARLAELRAAVAQHEEKLEDGALRKAHVEADDDASPAARSRSSTTSPSARGVGSAAEIPADHAAADQPNGHGDSDKPEKTTELSRGHRAEDKFQDTVFMAAFMADFNRRARLEEPDGWSVRWGRRLDEKEVEDLLIPDTPGFYILAKSVLVSAELELLAPDDEDVVDELVEGTMVRIVEVVTLDTAKRVRARLDAPAEGWISLKNMKTGTRWAEKQDDEPGSYVLTKTAFASPDLDNLSPDDDELVDELDEDTDIHVLEVVCLLVTGARWAEKLELKSEPEDDEPGNYVLTRTAFVSPDLDNLSPDDDELVGELDEGTTITILEVVRLVDAQRVRARLEDPAGWITLINIETGKRWADKLELKSEESQQDSELALKSEESQQESDLTLKSEESQQESELPLKSEESQQESELPLKSEESQQESELPLKSEESQQLDEDDEPGNYVLTRTAFVSPNLDNLSPDDDELVGELDEGTTITILEVVRLVDAQRVRARLEDPAGWITLINIETGKRWADKLELKSEESQQESELALKSEESQQESDLTLKSEESQQESVLPLKSEESQQESELPLKSEESQQESELPLKSEESQQLDEDDEPGNYVLTRTAFVSPNLDNLSPDDDELVGELDEGTTITILEVVRLVDAQRVRARLEDPAGWITLMNIETGKRWADKLELKSEESQQDSELALKSEESQQKSELALKLEEPQQESELPLKSEESQQESELPLKSEESQQLDEDDEPGNYVLTRTAFVSPDLDNLSPDDDELVGELDEGTTITILEVVRLVDAQRVRARLEDPAGWITLMNIETGKRWADKLELKSEESQQDSELALQPEESQQESELALKLETSQQESELPLKSEESQQLDEDDEPGNYVLTRTAFVSPDLDNLSPDDDELVGELDEGTTITILEVVRLVDAQRVRARLEDPAGWITLMNIETGKRWADKLELKSEESQQDSELALKSE
ncbi:unnamed protein product, partial [Polarella glacialis]